MTKTLKLDLRPAEESDLPFIYSSFIKSFVIPRLTSLRRAPQILRLDRQDVIYYWHRQMGNVFEQGNILVACDPEDQQFVLGYAAMRGDDLFFVYVRKLARRNGVATRLLTHLLGGGTHFTTLFHTKALAQLLNKVELPCDGKK